MNNEYKLLGEIQLSTHNYKSNYKYGLVKLTLVTTSGKMDIAYMDISTS
jgi:hypothetical protein